MTSYGGLSLVSVFSGNNIIAFCSNPTPSYQYVNIEILKEQSTSNLILKEQSRGLIFPTVHVDLPILSVEKPLRLKKPMDVSSVDLLLFMNGFAFPERKTVI